MAGYIGSKASVVSSGAERKKTFAISTTTTSLTGLSYTPTYVHVFHNGVRLVDGSDFTATNGTSITLSNSAVSGDEVVVISYSSFQVADHYNKTESDNRYINTAGDTLTGTLGGTAVNLSGDLAAVNTTLTGYLRGPASFTIDPATHADDTGLVIIAGNLQVDGSTTTINSTTLTVDDLNLTLASGAADSAAANGAGITIDGASASLLYSHSGTKFVLNKPLDVTGIVTTDGLTVDGSATFVSNSGANNLFIDGRSADNIGQVTFRSNDGATNYSQIQSRSTELKIKTLANIPMSFHTNNSPRITILNTGNVGIGNVVSQAYVNEGTYTTKLRVGSDTSGTDNASAIQIVGKDSSGNGILGVIEFLNHRDNDVVAKIAGRRDLGSGSHLGAGQLDFSTDDGNGNLDIRMSIDANGNVGIGTIAVTSPGLWYDTNPGYLAISHWATPPTPAAMLHLSDNSNDLDVPQIRIEGRENVGDTVLDIAVRDAAVRLNLVEGATDAGNGYGQMIFKTNAAANTSYPARGGFLFSTPAISSNLAIANTGNVGIGTSSPNSPLEVSSNAAQLRLSTATQPTNYYTEIMSLYDSANPFRMQGHYNGTTVKFIEMTAAGGFSGPILKVGQGMSYTTLYTGTTERISIQPTQGSTYENIHETITGNLNLSLLRGMRFARAGSIANEVKSRLFLGSYTYSGGTIDYVITDGGGNQNHVGSGTINWYAREAVVHYTLTGTNVSSKIVVNANQYTTAGNAGKFTISIRATNGDSHLSIQNRLGSLCYIGLKISVNYVG